MLPQPIADRARANTTLRNLYRLSRRTTYRTAVAARLGFAAQARTLPVERVGRLVRIATDAIVGYTAPQHWPEPQRTFVLSGRWDIDFRYDLDGYFRASPNYRSTFQIFAEGHPYWESEQFQNLRRSIETEGSHFRTPDMDALHAYFLDLQRVFEEIRGGGYRSQVELGYRGDDALDEVKVVVDRRGELLRAYGGNHRFAMAQILGVPTLPVLVVGVHEAWARRWFAHADHDLAAALNRGIAALGEGKTQPPSGGR